MFADDGFHPSPALHAAFADAVMASLPLPEEPHHGARRGEPHLDLAPVCALATFGQTVPFELCHEP